MASSTVLCDDDYRALQYIGMYISLPFQVNKCHLDDIIIKDESNTIYQLGNAIDIETFDMTMVFRVLSREFPVGKWDFFTDDGKLFIIHAVTETCAPCQSGVMDKCLKKSTLQNFLTAINKRTHAILTSSLMEAFKGSIFFNNDTDSFTFQYIKNENEDDSSDDNEGVDMENNYRQCALTYETDCYRKHFSSHVIIYCLLLIPMLIVYILLYCKSLVYFVSKYKMLMFSIIGCLVYILNRTNIDFNINIEEIIYKFI